MKKIYIFAILGLMGCKITRHKEIKTDIYINAEYKEEIQDRSNTCRRRDRGDTKQTPTNKILHPKTRTELQHKKRMDNKNNNKNTKTNKSDRNEILTKN